jgi:hypothetical protein
MTTLREARQQGKLKQFVAEHKGEVGDADAFNTTFAAMAGTSKATPEASSPGNRDD